MRKFVLTVKIAFTTRQPSTPEHALETFDRDSHLEFMRSRSNTGGWETPVTAILIESISHVEPDPRR